ncbi:MAG: hypothetical protein ACXVPD_03755 [Bacteroidia bacterium]
MRTHANRAQSNIDLRRSALTEGSNVIQASPETDNSEGDKTPAGDLKDIKNGVYEGCPDDLYAAAKRVLVADFAGELKLSEADKQLMISLVAGQSKEPEAPAVTNTVPQPVAVPLTDDLVKQAKSIIDSKHIIEALVKNSKPKDTDLMPGNEKRDEHLDEWKKNILANYNELMKTSQQEVFDLETKYGAGKRTEDLTNNLAYLHLKEEKLDYRSKKISNRQSRKGADKRKHKRDLKTEWHDTKKQIKNSEFVESENSSDDAEQMVGRQPRADYSKNIVNDYDQKKEEKEKSISNKRDEIHDKRRGLGKFFAGIVRYLRKHVKVDTGYENDYAVVLDPAKDFNFNYNGQNYSFQFAEITEDDITPLVIPRAKDSIVDMAPDNAPGNVFSRIKSLDANASTQTKKAYQDAAAPEIGDTSVEGLKSSREADQKQKTKDDLEAKYGDLYGFKTTAGEWTGANGDQMGDGKPYDGRGYARPETRTAFYYWIQTHMPDQVDDVEVLWDNDKKIFKEKMNKSDLGGKSSTDNDADEKKYNKQAAKAKELNDLIQDGGDDASLGGWDIDKVKQKLLVELSLQIIAPQKWMEGGAGTADIKVNNEYNDAGAVKKEQEKINSNKTGDVRTFVERQGKYNEADPKRYSGYDETTGTYLKNPDLRDKVDEELTWMINYKVRVLQ